MTYNIKQYMGMALFGLVLALGTSTACISSAMAGDQLPEQSIDSSNIPADDTNIDANDQESESPSGYDDTEAPLPEDDSNMNDGEASQEDLPASE